MTPAPLMNPEIKYVVQKGVREERADTRPLWSPPIRFVNLAALEDSRLEPHPDKPEHSWVGNPVCQHPHQPLVVNRVEEAGYRRRAPNSLAGS